MQQPRFGDSRQPHLPGQRVEYRPGTHHVQALPGYERPGTAPRRHRPGRQSERHQARGWLQHHGSERNHGGALPGRGFDGSQRAVREHARGIYDGRKTGVCARFRYRRGDGDGHERRDPAKPCPDTRAQSGFDPWRSVREHRPRLQLGYRDENRPAFGGLRRDGSGIWRGSGRGKVSGYQMPAGRPASGRGRDRGDDSRAQAARRRGVRGFERGKRGRDAKGMRKPGEAHRHDPAVWRSLHRGD